MKTFLSLLFTVCWAVGCSTPQEHLSKRYYVRQAFVDPSLEVMTAEVTGAAQIEWEGITINFANDSDVGRRIKHALEQGVGSEVVLQLPLEKADNCFWLLKQWVVFCERWKIPYSVKLTTQVGGRFKSTLISFSGRLEGNEILHISDWAAIATGAAKTTTLEQLQAQLESDFAIKQSHHLEIQLTPHALEKHGPRNLIALLDQLNAHPPPLCWYRVALVDPPISD